MPSDVVHGCCRGLSERGPDRCNKRTWLYLPGRLCGKCIGKVQERYMAALEAEFGDDESK